LTDVAIRVEYLGKRYRIGNAQQRHDMERDALMHNLGTRLHSPRRNGHANGSDTFWALKDVSFEVKRRDFLDKLEAGATDKEIRGAYPHREPEDIRAGLESASVPVKHAAVIIGTRGSWGRAVAARPDLPAARAGRCSAACRSDQPARRCRHRSLDEPIVALGRG
jgi:hypothetical protein